MFVGNIIADRQVVTGGEWNECSWFNEVTPFMHEESFEHFHSDFLGMCKNLTSRSGHYKHQ